MERFGVTAEFEDATYQLPIMELCELNGKCFRQLAVPQVEPSAFFSRYSIFVLKVYP